MELQDLKKSISKLSDEEIRALLSGIRANRRVSKKPPAKSRSAAPRKVEGESMQMSTLINSLSKEQIAEFLAKMGDSK